MKHLIIVGAGGMGRSICSIAKGCIGYDIDFSLKGFIDDDSLALEDFENYPPYLGSIKDYVIQPNDVFICSIGNTHTKRTVCEYLKTKGAKFYTLIHKLAVIRQNAKIGEGSLVAEYASVGVDAIVGENSLVQSFATVAHDCRIGDYVRIDTHCTCVGGVIVEDNAMIHTGAIISHNVVVGKDAHVGAGSFVIKKVKAGTTVFGSPARYLK